MRWLAWRAGRPRSRARVAELCAAAAIGVPLIVALALVLTAEPPARLHLFVGRLHPLVVHLPIGFLVLAVLLEGLSRLRPFVRLRHAVAVVLVLGAASAILAVGAGYLLATGGAYEGPNITWHRRLGIGVAVGSLGAALLGYAARVRPRVWLRRAYAASLLAAFAMLLGAGHIGGKLSRGPDYLSEYMPAPLQTIAGLLPATARGAAVFTPRDELGIYEHLVAPVFHGRCVSCHGPDKQSGGLRLDSPEGIERGGDSGVVLVAGSAAESELIRRIWLPEAHEEHMPPRGRKPLTIAEAELLRWWIAEGGSFEQPFSGSEPPRVVLDIVEQIAGPADVRRPPVLRKQVSAAEPGAVRRARDSGLSLEPLAAGSPFLRVRCGHGTDACGSAEMQTLLPLAEQVASLDLSRAQITDEDLGIVARLPHLTRLRLDQTPITDAGLAHLAGLEHLEYLNLVETAITDAGLASLSNLKNLRSVYLWRTVATPAGAARLRESSPRVYVNLGLSPGELDSLSLVRPPAASEIGPDY